MFHICSWSSRPRLTRLNSVRSTFASSQRRYARSAARDSAETLSVAASASSAMPLTQQNTSSSSGDATRCVRIGTSIANDDDDDDDADADAAAADAAAACSAGEGGRDSSSGSSASASAMAALAALASSARASAWFEPASWYGRQRTVRSVPRPRATKATNACDSDVQSCTPLTLPPPPCEAASALPCSRAAACPTGRSSTNTKPNAVRPTSCQHGHSCHRWRNGSTKRRKGAPSIR